MQRIGVPGLPSPQILYPAGLVSVPFTMGSNEIALNAGQSIDLPSGDWVIDLGRYSVLEVLDPVQTPVGFTQTSGVWRVIRSQRGTFMLRSDGQNYRVSNLTGCAVAAVIGDTGGKNYTSAPTITASAGNSSWVATVGGALGAFSVVAAGTGYTVAPIVYIPAPPTGGVPATAYATLSGSTLGSITLTSIGAGYTTIPLISILPNPFDPGLLSISNASAVASLSNSGQVTAVICTNNGTPVTALSATLTFTGGGGTSASATVYFMSTVTSISVTTAGSSLNTGALLSTMGGQPTAGSFTNPIAEYTDFVPRQCQINLSLNSTGGVGSLLGPIIDGGLYMIKPTTIAVVGNKGAPFAAASVVDVNMGSTQDIVFIQPM